ncbi:hypothetical protein DXG01_002326 [Tephrocybe rancida]|nr:hypothetical protein DXG01_002326 [Tephrocybe rancida]
MLGSDYREGVPYERCYPKAQYLATFIEQCLPYKLFSILPMTALSNLASALDYWAMDLGFTIDHRHPEDDPKAQGKNRYILSLSDPNDEPRDTDLGQLDFGSTVASYKGEEPGLGPTGISNRILNLKDWGHIRQGPDGIEDNKTLFRV